MVLTGASSGIGRAAAEALAARGDALVLAARREDELRVLARTLDASGSRVVAGRADVAVQADREALIEAARAQFGRVDALVNNAGISIARGMWWDDPDPLRVLEVNLTAPIELTRLVLPEMRARGRGHIVNVGSVAGRAATHGMYSASKFGLRGFSLALRRELLGSGVHVSLIAPGFVRTELTAAAKLPMPGPDVVARAIADVLDRPRREVIVPRFYGPLAALEAALPGLGDAIVERIRARRYGA